MPPHLRAAFIKLDHHLDAELPRLQRHLDAVYDEIKARAPGATVIVLGYPPLFEDSWASAACPSAALTRGERADLREGAERLDAAIKEVAERAGFRFVDPSAAFEDHRLCSSGAGWLNGITVERSGEDTGTCVREPELVDALLPPSDGDRSYACLSPGSFHPNVAGQAAFAEVIAATNPDIFR